MKVQIYSYLDLPNGSICNVAYRWYLELSRHFVVRFLPLGISRTDAFPEVDVGELNSPDVSIIIGYPSIITKMARDSKFFISKRKIGVFVSDTFLAGREIESLKVERFNYNITCVPSEYCRAIFAQHRPRTMVVHHGIAPAYYPRDVGKENLRTYLAIYHQSPSGGTYIRKNIKGVIEAFRMLQEKYQEVQLIVKSSLYENNEITKDIKDTKNVVVSYLPLGNDELACLYSRCHAHVTATLAEGFGITPLEAMACGINVISPIHSGLAEYLNSSNCIEIPHYRGGASYDFAMNSGRLMKVHTEDIFKAMEIDFLGNHSLCPRELSKWARENFSWPNALKNIVGWISER